MTAEITEAPSLEAGVLAAERLIDLATTDADAASPMLAKAQADVSHTESLHGSIQAAGIRGGVTDALVAHSDARAEKVRAAEAWQAACDSELAAARRLREELRPHEGIADTMATVDGVADKTVFYGAS